MWFIKEPMLAGHKLSDYVLCYYCGQLILNDHAKVVEVIGRYDFMTYCKSCAPKYDRMITNNQGTVSYYIKGNNWVEVTEDGEVNK